ncbi:MAG: hypothetical protein RJA99_3164 [Pseudomonadota bacterium]|jgi:hypothetical protein
MTSFIFHVNSWSSVKLSAEKIARLIEQDPEAFLDAVGAIHDGIPGPRETVGRKDMQGVEEHRRVISGLRWIAEIYTGDDDELLTMLLVTSFGESKRSGKYLEALHVLALELMPKRCINAINRLPAPDLHARSTAYCQCVLARREIDQVISSVLGNV